MVSNHTTNNAAPIMSRLIIPGILFPILDSFGLILLVWVVILVFVELTDR